MPLAEDRIRALEAHPVIPDGEVIGTYLTRFRATSEFEAADDDEDESQLGWTSGPDKELIPWHGDPNTVLFAAKGDLAVDVDTPALWQNTDGQSAWTAVGGSSTNYWERTANDLHLDPTNTSGLETLSVNWTDSGGVDYSIDANTGDLVLECGKSGVSDSTLDITATGTFGQAIIEGQFTSSGNTSQAFLSSIALASSANTEIEAKDGHSHTAKIEVNADNGNTPTTYAKVSAAEMLFRGMNAAPASGDLAAGDFGLWLDSTNGAGKLMIKAKTADGTVVTGSVTLT